MATSKAGNVVKSGFYSAVGLFFEYDTPKIVHINSKKVGIINRLIQLIIIGYIVGYAIVYNKGYQDFDEVVSAASTKVKGVTYTNLSAAEWPGIGHRIWDPADYVIPPQENNAFFVMTNAVVSVKQSQDTCPEDPSHKVAKCEKDSDCEAGKPVENGNGVRTGVCNTTVKMCEILAWCPVEIDDNFPYKDRALINDSDTFTVLIKNQIEFPKFGEKRRNILDSYNKTYLTGCRYNQDSEYDRFCPIFQLGYIVKQAGEDYAKLAQYGGFILINIHWDCNLDRSIDKCVPQYSFKRLDDKDSLISPGWNFRYANYYYEEGTQYRDLIKAYGIRFVIKVTGQAGKFSIVPLLVNLGSGIGLLALATVICDIVVLYIVKKGPYYKDKKYLYVKGDDAFNAVIEDADDPPQERDLHENASLRDPVNSSNQGAYGATDHVEAAPGEQSVDPYASGQVLDDFHPSETSTDITFEIDEANASSSGVKNRRGQNPGEYSRFDNEDD